MSHGKLKSPAVATRRPFLITFSGIDGAGKSTQIDALAESLQNLGLRVVRRSFWDNVAVWSNLRAEVGGRTEDSPESGKRSFTPRNNKHIRKWYLTAARSGLYLLDVASLRRLLESEPIKEADVVIFDRYVYDQIANIDSQSVAARLYGKMVLRQTPTPDLAFVIDASPDAAFARKPEYPLAFMHQNRENFLRLRELAPELIIIPDGTLDDVKSEILFHINRSRLIRGARIFREDNSEGTSDPVARERSSCRPGNEPTASV